MSITKNDKNARTTGRPTLSEVACRAGVSPITASHASRGVASVAEELTQKVHDVARELDYVVNSAVRVLTSAQSHSVTALVPSLANLLFIETLEMIHAVLWPQGLGVLISNLHYSRNGEEGLIRNYLAHQPRGLLLVGFKRTKSAQRMIGASGIPCVCMMDLDSGAGLSCVSFSQSRAGEAATKHLLVRGRRRLAYIGAQLNQHTLLRGERFRHALQKIDCYDPGLEILTPRPSLVVLGGELFVQLLAGQPQVDRVFFCNDDLTQGALLGALRREVRVPEQIAMLSFNDPPGSDCTVPRLSSIRTPHEAVDRRAAEQLLALVTGKEVRDNVLDVGFELIVRGST